MASKAMKVPASVWIVGVLALLWNLVGVAAFVMQVAMPAEALGAMPAEQRAIYEATPAWLYVFSGLATFGGVAGSIGLLLRRRWAVPEIGSASRRERVCRYVLISLVAVDFKKKTLYIRY